MKGVQKLEVWILQIRVGAKGTIGLCTGSEY